MTSLLYALLLVLPSSNQATSLARPPSPTSPQAADESTSDLWVTSQIQMLEDPTGHLHLSDVASGDRHFVPTSGRTVRLSRPDVAYWLRFTYISSDEEEPLVLRIRRNRCELLQVFIPVGLAAADAEHRQYEEAWRVSTTSFGEFHGIGNTLQYALPHSRPSGSNVYLRARSRFDAFLEVDVTSASDNLRITEANMLWLGTFYGLTSVLALINLLFFIVFREAQYFWYAIFKSLFIAYFASQDGFFTALQPEMPAEVAARLSLLAIALMAAASSSFSRSFLCTRALSPFADRLLTIYLVVGLGFAVLLPLMEVGSLYIVARAVGGAMPFLFLLAGAIRLREGFRPARFFVLAWSFLGVGTFLFALPAFDSRLGLDLLRVCVALEALLLALALVDRMRALRDERETLGRRVKASERLFRSLAQSTSAGILVFDREGNLIYFNRAAREDFGEIGRWNDVVERASGKSRERLSQLFASPTSGTLAPRREEIELTTIEGSRWYELDMGVFYLDERPHLVMTAIDITERKLAHEADQKLLHAEKMAVLGQLVASVGHEINNPNSFVSFNLPVLQKYLNELRPVLERLDDKYEQITLLGMSLDAFFNDATKLIEDMQYGSERIARIVSELRSYVRSQGNDERTLEHLGNIFDRVMLLIGKEVERSVAHLEVDLQNDLPPVRVNAGKLEQVIMNLLLNAAQACDEEDSWIRLGARANDDFVEIAVEDNGCGIPETDLSRIFVPFFTTKSSESGTGLGLAISERIIRELGGSITVESEIDRGTRFRVKLPIFEEASA